MRINHFTPQHRNNTSFKKWVEREYTETIRHDRYPDNPDYHFYDYETETYTKTEWFPEYDDYYSDETIKEDAIKYARKPNKKEFLKAVARARIIVGNKKEHAKAPKFGFFSIYRSLANDYVKKVQEYIKNNDM